MNWQEYQQIVAQLYEQAEGIGTVYENITRADKITGQSRQIDAWLEIETKGVNLGVLIDAKYHKQKVDIKTVEEVLALADSVGAASSIIVCSTTDEQKEGEFPIDTELFLVSGSNLPV